MEKGEWNMLVPGDAELLKRKMEFYNQMNDPAVSVWTNQDLRNVAASGQRLANEGREPVIGRRLAMCAEELLRLRAEAKPKPKVTIVDCGPAEAIYLDGSFFPPAVSKQSYDRLEALLKALGVEAEVVFADWYWLQGRWPKGQLMMPKRLTDVKFIEHRSS